MHDMFQLVIVVRKTASLECIRWGAKKKEVGGCQIGTVGTMRKNKLKEKTTADKVLASIFWGSEGILLMELLREMPQSIQSNMCRY